MPEVSRFYGITIYVFVERGERHNLPHFHVNYHEFSATYRMEPIELMSGSLPLRQRRFVEAMGRTASSRTARKLATLLQNDQPCKRIAPLE